MKYEYIGEQSITLHGIGEAGARMSEIELPEPDVQETAEFMRGMLVDGGCYTAEQVRAAILAERERCARVCEELPAWNMDDPGESAAAAIRRGSV